MTITSFGLGQGTFSPVSWIVTLGNWFSMTAVNWSGKPTVWKSRSPKCPP